MKKIEFSSFLLAQPNFPEEMSTDRYFYDLANRLVDAVAKIKEPVSLYESAVHRAALCVIGYFQDIIADAGIWRSFINQNRRFYNRTLPFFEVGDNYIDYELNIEDIKFLVWYAIAMHCEDKRDISPLDSELLKISSVWHEILEGVYDETPVPEGYHLAHEVELHAQEDAEKVLRLGQWVAHHCYLMTPADSLSLYTLLSANADSHDDIEKLRSEVNRMLTSSPIGPLALFLREWMYLIIEDRLPRRKVKEEKEPHKYFLPFLAANNNKPMKIFSSYEELNRFLIEALGWDPEVEHLSQLKGAKNFILLVNREKGMLVAVNIAQYICTPENTLYDKREAEENSFSLLTVRGRCPGDLLIYLCKNRMLPDAAFPSMPEDKSLVDDNWDFIARCYLQNYYRED